MLKQAIAQLQRPLQIVSWFYVYISGVFASEE